ncbi:MAG: formate dehydrogenase family accessory protein FdhD [SAR86 cluster bacterium]|uniref:Sulfur carrier protein FdhD n=1 Tax=SAR86 cluster bacterium TaxID=2030880 RepID=A0A2A5CD86_9GAMM|nr:MAG: formate dehydrogenase family accessory protein FdhD [SAR86 cluster bacterium]
MFINTIKVNPLSATSKEQDDVVADEEPLEIRLGYIDAQRGRVHKSIAITMRTPGQDIELTLGFLFSENIIQSANQIMDVDTTKDNLIRIELSNETSFDLKRLERHFYTTSSCGVCGKASLEALSMNGAEVQTGGQFQIRAEQLVTLGENLRIKQNLFHSTGGTHACGLFDNLGVVLELAEDIGRHNAMDKLIGQRLMAKALPLRKNGLIVSGRASFELLQKALMAQSPLLIAVGAPSSLAVELAQEFNISLVGFLSDTEFNIYHDDDRIIV